MVLDLAASEVLADPGGTGVLRGSNIMGGFYVSRDMTCFDGAGTSVFSVDPAPFAVFLGQGLGCFLVRPVAWVVLADPVA